MGVIRKLLNAGMLIVEDALDGYLDRDGRQTMDDAFRRTRERAGELALENAGLHDRIETMTVQLNELMSRIQTDAPVLYRDEVQAIGFAMEGCDAGTRATLQTLLNRSPHSPLTSYELSRWAMGVINGEIASAAAPAATHDWMDSEQVEDVAHVFIPALEGESCRACVCGSDLADEVHRPGHAHADELAAHGG